MVEYNDVIKQFKRMCWYYSRDKGQKSCPMCTSYPNCNIEQCRKIAFEKPAHFAATVMRWAAKHPEPVYPTWVEWLVDIGVFPQKMSTIPSVAFNTIRDSLSVEIPADIAEKLGVKPKEG